MLRVILIIKRLVGCHLLFPGLTVTYVVSLEPRCK